MRRLLLLLPLLLVLVPRVAAQDNPITWTVVPGYDGTFKSGAWIPVTVTVANNGNDLRGRLEWSWGTGGTRFSQTVDLPRGAEKRIVLPVVADSFGAEATLALLEGDRAVMRERVRYNQVDSNTLVVGVLSDEGNVLPEVAGLRNPLGSPTTLVRLEPAALPERWELLQSLDVLFVHGTDTTAWNDAQRGAVARWVAGGGRLVVGGDRATTAAGIGAVLPAQVDPATRDLPLAGLREQTGWTPREAGATVKALGLRLEPDAEVVVATAEGAPLIAGRAHGRGLVLQAAFDLAALSAQGNPVPLWERLLPRFDVPPQWQLLRSNAQWVLREALALPALRLPSIWTILGFLALYIGLVGPVNYLLLRRFDRREWAYLTVPLTVALFTAGAYGLGAAGRGGAPMATALTVVRAAPGSTTGASLSYVGLFSPTRRSYQVGFAPEALVSNAFSPFEGRGDSLQVVRGESAVEVPSFLVDVGALRPLLAEQVAPAPPVLVTFQPGGPLGGTLEIENRSAERLEDVAIMIGDNIQKTDDFEPGERRTVQLDPGRFGGEGQFQSGGVIRRTGALNALRGSFFMPPMVAPAVPAPEMGIPVPAAPAPVVTLLAWSAGPNLALTLNGAPVEVQGDTLFMWAAEER